MTPKKRTTRLYWRGAGEIRRAYGDFRDFADVGGGQEALIPLGQHFATDDPDTAEQLVAARVRELETRRRNKVMLGIEAGTTLGEYVVHHLIQKKLSRKVDDDWIARSELRLKRAIEFFEQDGPRDLMTIGVRDVQQWMDWLRTIKSVRTKTSGMESGTLRKHLFSLSNLYRRAQSENLVTAGFNPVAAMMDKPEEPDSNAEWLEVHEAALFIEAARHYKPHKNAHHAMPADRTHALIATFLLTGAREVEAYGLLTPDISFDRHAVHIRANKVRRIKTRNSRRTIPLWPQLEEILRAYVFGRSEPPTNLLFPSTRATTRITDIRKTLDAIARTCGWSDGEIRTKMFRHTYCAARLQTMDRGQPVSLFTVAGEMGHGGVDLVKRVYGHLGDVRHRSDVVEYRFDDWQERVQDRIHFVRH